MRGLRRALLHAACTRLDETAQRWVHEGDIRWDIGSREFGLGLFRGVAGVGFAVLRTLDPSLPRVVVWD